MKKLLCILLCAFISIGVHSQKVVRTKGCYDANNVAYIKTQIYNNTRKTIVSIVFTIEYEFPSMWDVDRYKQTIVKTYIKPGSSQIITYYPRQNYYRPISQTLSRVIFSDGTYKEF